MKRNMNYSATLTLHRNNSDLQKLMQVIAHIIEEIDHTKELIKNGLGEIIYCYKLRRDRRQLRAIISHFLKEYATLSETNKVSTELYFYHAANKLEALLPVAQKEIKDKSNFVIGYFLYRELNKMTDLIQNTQKEMASALYKDPSAEVLADPNLYKELEEAWGDWAKD